jgi:hypothetical protein
MQRGERQRQQAHCPTSHPPIVVPVVRWVKPPEQPKTPAEAQTVVQRESETGDTSAVSVEVSRLHAGGP